jgi:hypothetical protein
MEPLVGTLLIPGSMKQVFAPVDDQDKVLAPFCPMLGGSALMDTVGGGGMITVTVALAEAVSEDPSS